MERLFIYSLNDPITNEIKYIGKTNNIKKRLYSHIREAKSPKSKRYVIRWIRTLIEIGLEPFINVIEEVSEENWGERETYWIDYYREINPKLCNIANGGLGGSGIKNFSEEELKIKSERMSKQFSKFTDEEKCEIWKLIQKNYTLDEIKSLYTNYTRHMDFGVRNGRVWNKITQLQPIFNRCKRNKGYTFQRNLFFVKNKNKKVIFSSKIEADVQEFLKQQQLK